MYFSRCHAIQRFACTLSVLTGILNVELNRSWHKWRLSGRLHAYPATEKSGGLDWFESHMKYSCSFVLGKKDLWKTELHKTLKLACIVNNHSRERRTKLKFAKKFHLSLRGWFSFPGSLYRLNQWVSLFINDKSYWKVSSMTCLSLKRLQKKMGLVRLQLSHVMTNYPEAV